MSQHFEEGGEKAEASSPGLPRLEKHDLQHSWPQNISSQTSYQAPLPVACVPLSNDDWNVFESGLVATRSNVEMLALH